MIQKRLMFEKPQTSTMVSEINTRHKTKNRISNKKTTIWYIIGTLLILITIILQSIAFFTPHWKEISPNTHSLYVDGVDALIRTET